MDERTQIKNLRREFGITGWTLLIYNQIMQFCVLGACVVEIVPKLVRAMTENAGSDAVMRIISDSLLRNGWGYALAIAVGLLIVWLWKGKDFCGRVIWTRGRPMSVIDFLSLLCVFVSGQLLFQLTAVLQEYVLNLFGLSALGAMEAAAGMEDTFSMFLYAGLLAPVAEELLFRGLILRTLLPYGKRFAILTSAFLFGLFHGNVVQSPYAFCVGLILGYTAVEYSIGWSMVLHMFNNLVLADALPRLTAGLPEGIGDGIVMGLIIAMSVIALVIAICRRKEIRAYVRENKVEDRNVRGFFTAPGVIVLTVYMWVNMAMMLVL